MRRIWTNYVRAVFILAVLFLLSACKAELWDAPQGPQEVALCASTAQTRTEMLSNGLSATWKSDDKIAVWAKNSSGSFVLSNQTFGVYGSGDGHGYFTSTLQSSMADGTYTYLCCYPKPESVTGTKVTFTLPAEQDGKVSGGADIMIADPVKHGPLATVSEIEDGNGLSMKMNRMMHQFRFYIPEEVTALGDDHIRKIKLTFPKNVVGKVTYDLTDPSAAPVITEGSNVVTVTLDKRLIPTDDEGREYACVAILPTQFEAGEDVQVKAFTPTKMASIDPISLQGRKFDAGHSTPVRLNIKGLEELPYKITFTVAANNLGEDVDKIELRAPQNCSWNNGSGVYTHISADKIGNGDSFVIYFDDEASYRNFSGKDITVTYDSEHAITSQTVNIGNVSNTDVANVSLTVPYLFFEDFSTLEKYDGDYRKGPYVSVDGASTPAKDLSAYGLEAGWTGARTGCDNAGSAIIVGGRVDWVSLGATRAYGRLDSPAMTSLKAGANVNLELAFNYSGSKDGASKYSHAAIVGTTIETGLLNGYATQYNNDKSWSGVTMPIEIEQIPTNGSAATANLVMKSEFKNCSSLTRFTWHVVAMGKGGLFDANNANTWLYVDNIRVKIIQ